jgi:tRNA1(Val) A37 N6-methylase TrmN6
MPSYSLSEKIEISRKIKNITQSSAIQDFIDLQQIGQNAAIMSPRCRKGNDIVDYFTFCQRLETKGKYNATFFDFLENVEEYKKKKFIKNMLQYYEEVKNKNKTKNEFIVYKEVYNICISAINIFRPLMAMEVYIKYKPTTVLDICAGWGGRLVGACALNIKEYIGIEINKDLLESYSQMTSFFSDEERKVDTKIRMFFEDATKFDYSKIEYDMVLTSPPYYALEKYPNNINYETKKEMNEQFYSPLIKNSYQYLKPGGHYCLNVNKDIYDNVCLDVLGPATSIMPFKKSKRQNEYNECIYVWDKLLENKLLEKV